jgi:hypothetical protein
MDEWLLIIIIHGILTLFLILSVYLSTLLRLETTLPMDCIVSGVSKVLCWVLIMVGYGGMVCIGRVGLVLWICIGEGSFAYGLGHKGSR